MGTMLRRRWPGQAGTGRRASRTGRVTEACCFLARGGARSLSRRMRALALAVLTGPAVASPAQSASPITPSPVQASYTASWAGFSIVTLDASLELGAEAYRVVATMRTAGLLATFVRGEQITLVEGRVQPQASPLALLPARFSMEGRWRGTPRRVALRWTDGQPEVLALIPANQEERDPVPPELQRGTVDTLTALAALVRQAASSNRCEGTAQVFDGRRRSDFTATTDGMDRLEPTRWSGFSGPALRCRFEGRQIAGFWKEQDRDEAARPRAGRAWFASPAPGLPVIPVRIEAESSWGTVYVHMTRAAPGLIPLPAQQTDRR